MPKIPPRLTLQEMLRYCGDPASPFREHAWREFNDYYGKYLSACVRKRCHAWNAPRLKMQREEVVDDIVGKVLFELCKDGGKVLRSFKNVDDEKKFLAWLGVICQRASYRFLQQKWLEMATDEVFDRHGTESEQMDLDFVWELYDLVVKSLRNSAKRSTDIRERNINFFLLSTFGSFTETMIRSLSCFQGLGERVVQVEVYRLREALRADRDFSP